MGGGGEKLGRGGGGREKRTSEMGLEEPRDAGKGILKRAGLDKY